MSFLGHLATLGASVIPEPIGIVPCLALSSSSSTFTKGVMSGAIPWHLLEKQLGEYRQEITAVGGQWLYKDHESAFNAGVEYAQARIEEGSSSSNEILNSIRIPFLSNNESFDQETFERLEAVNFMRGIMDECTHLANYSVPLDPSLCIAICALDDAYQPRDAVTSIPDLWPGAQIRYVSGGHVASYILKQSEFRTAIYDSLDALMDKHGPHL